MESDIIDTFCFSINFHLFFFPGLSFRPQANSNLNDIQTFISLSSQDNIEIYTKNLDEFFKICK